MRRRATSLVFSECSNSSASRTYFCIGSSRITPMPPKICAASSGTETGQARSARKVQFSLSTERGSLRAGHRDLRLFHHLLPLFDVALEGVQQQLGRPADGLNRIGLQALFHVLGLQNPVHFPVPQSDDVAWNSLWSAEAPPTHSLVSRHRFAYGGNIGKGSDTLRSADGDGAQSARSDVGHGRGGAEKQLYLPGEQVIQRRARPLLS